MSRIVTFSFLQDEIELLVQHFGVEKVRAALAKVSNGTAQASANKVLSSFVKRKHGTSLSVTSMLEECRQKDEKKYYLLNDFYAKLKYGEVLRESQDILHFAQIVGLKEISGKSRKEMIPKLMRFLLLEQTTEQLQSTIKKSADISEQQRQQGFSVLTDKILGRR